MIRELTDGEWRLVSGGMMTVNMKGKEAKQEAGGGALTLAGAIIVGAAVGAWGAAVGQSQGFGCQSSDRAKSLCTYLVLSGSQRPCRQPDASACHGLSLARGDYRLQRREFFRGCRMNAIVARHFADLFGEARVGHRKWQRHEPFEKSRIVRQGIAIRLITT